MNIQEMNKMAETTKTFLELIKDYKIIIPLIQRDLLKVEKKKKIKQKNFLKLLKMDVIAN